jgi:hypothetical protein
MYAKAKNQETMSARFVYLDDGKVSFNNYTMPPHAEVIVEIVEQIGLQNRNPKLLQGGTGGSMSICGCPLTTTDVNLVPGSDKQPDGHWED